EHVHRRAQPALRRGVVGLRPVRRVHLVALDTGGEGRREAARGGRGRTGTFGPVNSTLTRYRVMATVVGVLLIVLCLIGVPLANFDGSGMWGIFPSTPAWFPVGSTAHEVGELITTYLGVAHGWLYMLFLITAFQLSRRERW